VAGPDAQRHTTSDPEGEITSHMYMWNAN